MHDFKKTHISEVATVNPESLGRNFSFNKIFYIDISTVGTGTADEPQEIELKKAPSRAKRLVKSGDTILSTVRPNRRSFLYIKEPKENLVVSTGFAVVRPEKVNSRYLYYVISDQTFTDYLTRHAKGSAYPAVDAETIERADFMLPSETEQNTIADILGAYDDLIENNSRRIKILEQMAQAIYTEWFVNFRFPNHEKVKMIESGTEFGKIPEGWKSATLSDLVENVRDATPAGEILKERNYVPIDVIDSQSLTLLKYNPWTEAKSSLILFEKGDILFGAMRPYFHKVAIAPFPGVTRGTCLVLRPKYNLAYCALTMFQKETVDFATANSQGATIPYINWNVLAKKKCLIPSSDVMSSYSKYVQPLLELNQRLAQEHEKLIKSRDLLLPKLVTGEIRI